MMAAGCGESPRPVVSNGAALFRENGCATCHGAEGRGDGPSARGTAIHPRNLSDRTSYRNGASAGAIAKTIASGIRNADGSGMPAFAHIPDGERRAIAEFIVTLQRKDKS